jgi:hypothetical protein
MKDNSKFAQYTPLTHREQDALLRLATDQDFYVEIVGWGFHNSPKVTTGDKRIQVAFPLEFTAPSFIMPVSSFHLRLKLRDGTVVYEEEMSCGGSIPVTEGVRLDLVWDISFGKLPEVLVSRVRGAAGGGVGVTKLASVPNPA